MCTTTEERERERESIPAYIHLVGIIWISLKGNTGYVHVKYTLIRGFQAWPKCLRGRRNAAQGLMGHISACQRPPQLLLRELQVVDVKALHDC